MTTAHRPTWNAAVGQSNQGGWQSHVTKQYGARELPSHTRLKFRYVNIMNMMWMGQTKILISQVGQGTANEVELRDLKQELEEKERKYEENKKKEAESGGKIIHTLDSNELDHSPRMSRSDS